MIRTRTTYYNDDGFEFTFKPIKDTLSIETVGDGYTAKYLVQDTSPIDPREFEDFGKMMCWHNKYSLGGKHDWKTPEDFREYWTENKDKLVVLPLYLYDHSGLSMSTTRDHYPYNCPWDSGQVGWIYAEKGTEGLTDEQIISNLRGEVEVYNMYLSGDCYGLVAERYDKDKKQIGRNDVWGVFGFEEAKKELKNFP